MQKEPEVNIIDLIKKGELMTDAKYIREFVLNHQKYQKDSVITKVIFLFIISTQEINFDLIKQLLSIQNGETYPKQLFDKNQD